MNTRQAPHRSGPGTGANSAQAPLTPEARYQALVDAGEVQPDPAQREVLRYLQALALALPDAPGYGALDRLLLRVRPGNAKIEPLRGLYLWGGVGRGKTFLVDLFYSCLPAGIGLRTHFHRFMFGVHEQLNELNHVASPLDKVADRLARRARIICFDEFFVSDIADAMILGNLFEGLFRRGVSLVATSNVVPQELYRDGLQRSRFLPTIDLIEKHTDIVHLQNATDYRLRALEQAEIYHSPLDQAADHNLLRSFNAIAPDTGHDSMTLELNGRSLATRRLADGVVWFDFDEICGGPRSAADYIEIARCFHTVIVSGVPILTVESENEARRFISLVDEFYDRNVKLILSAATELETLYRGRRLEFEFRRTESRLIEMQSRDYLASEHLP